MIPRGCDPTEEKNEKENFYTVNGCLSDGIFTGSRVKNPRISAFFR